MKQLRDILYKAGIVEITGSTQIEVPAICFDSRKVTKGCLFIAVRGIKSDGKKIKMKYEKSLITGNCYLKKCRFINKYTKL